MEGTLPWPRRLIGSERDLPTRLFQVGDILLHTEPARGVILGVRKGDESSQWTTFLTLIPMETEPGLLRGSENPSHVNWSAGRCHHPFCLRSLKNLIYLKAHEISW
jgi:hypothetical protein